jgi:hypothetical protein
MGLLYSFNATTTTPFGSGVTINFRLRAMNGVGFGAYSTNLPVITDKVP